MPDKDDSKTKSTLTRDELQSMIKTAVGDLVETKVKEHVEPLSAQATEWMETIRRSENKSDDVRNKSYPIGTGATRFIRALAAGKGDPDRAARFAGKAWDDTLGDRVQKALQASDFTAGGALLPEDMAAEIIELLRNAAVVRRAGARVIPMPTGSITIRKQTAGSTATYVGESQNITVTEPTAGQIVLTSKKLAAVVPISNDLLRFDAGTLADDWVRDDLVMNIATREDQAFIRDTGTQDTPKGMRYWAQSANVTATNGTSAANIEADFKDLLQDLEGNNVRMLRPVWLMAPRSKNHLLTLRDANGNLIYPELRTTTPTIHMYPVFLTNNIPTNLGTGADETELYLVDMADAIIAESSAVEVTVDSSASYVESGSLVSAFQRDETLMRVITRHDFAMRHEESAAIKTGITWGS